MIDGKLGVAIHGAGQGGHPHAASWRREPARKDRLGFQPSPREHCRLAEKFDLDCAIYDSFHEILRDDRVDIVNLSGPNHVHAEQGIAAAEAGNTVVHGEADVPFHGRESSPGGRGGEGRRAERRELRLAMESFVREPQVALGRQRDRRAVLRRGRLLARPGGPWWTGYAWGHTKAGGGSAMLLGGCHAVDAVRWFAGGRIVEVAAFGNNLKRNFEFDANVVALFKFQDGKIGKTSALFDAEMPYAFNIDLAGAKERSATTAFGRNDSSPARPAGPP